MARRPSLLRLQEEVSDPPVIPLERATSASSAVAPPSLLGRSPRGGDTDRDGEDSGETTDVPFDEAFETDLGTGASYELAPDSVPTSAGDTADSPPPGTESELLVASAEEPQPTEAPLLDINENRGQEAGQVPGPPQVFSQEEIVRRLDEAEAARVQTEEQEPVEDTFRRRHSLDIALLSRHIDHMQRICRASLTDLTLSRQRRQIIRLQGIRRMLEDLQRQIRTLQASSELQGGAEEQQDQEAVPSSQPSQRFPLYPGSRHRHLLPRVRRSSSSSGLGPLRAQTMLASRSRLSRAHNQLVSQLRATFRAMERSPDLARGGAVGPQDLTTASREVLEHTDATSTRPLPPSLAAGLSPSTSTLVTPSSPSTPRDVVTAARNDLRSMSQRLERLLRERREAMERRPREAEQQERELERRTLDILDRRLGRGADSGLGLAPVLTDSSPSDSEEERTAEAAAQGRDMMDYFDQGAYLRNRSAKKDKCDDFNSTHEVKY